ncbi:MAG: ATP-binding cassette domain-containing protein, partial [Clostridia bacterium]|nr:ATP-binding cassette domain-containing protein [Clostridia bacterium]
MKVLELINVNKDYKLANKEKFKALKNINISFEKGELVSIIGESGSGKSTLMNLIGGLDSDYEGIINIDGKALNSFKEKQLDDYRKKKIGFVFQSFNLIPHLSVIDNVTISLTLSNVSESEKKAKAIELLTKLGLKDQIKKKPT